MSADPESVQPEPIKVGEFETEPVEKLGLKHETEEELLDNLLAAAEWTDEERQRITSAYETVRQAHEENIYRGQPYVYHLLRIANRIVRYMEVADADVVVAALSHDLVEDHAKHLVSGGIKDPEQLQAAALSVMAEEQNPRTAQIVKLVTNKPPVPGEKLTYEEKLARYAAKVDEATSTFDSWLVKFADWCENGLGIIHSELPADSEEIQHFGRKYGGDVLAVFSRRFREYKHLLTPKAANYVATQLTLGYQRLELGLR